MPTNLRIETPVEVMVAAVTLVLLLEGGGGGRRRREGSGKEKRWSENVDAEEKTWW